MRWIGNLGVIVCCALSAAIIVGTVSWMGEHSPRFTADEALAKANQTLANYCVRHHLDRGRLKLINATAPGISAKPSENSQEQWQFEFYSPKTGPILVQIPETGHSLAVVKPLS